jgi:cytochrome c553
MKAAGAARLVLRSGAVRRLFAVFLLSASAYAQPVPDTLEQRLLACAACHGKRGVWLKANEYYPRIAGKPAGYLYNQLLNFRERRRHSPPMNYMVAYLSDGYLREIAGHYAALAPAYPPPARAPGKAVLERGEALMLRGDPLRKIPPCTACHGEALTGVQPAIPGLLGLDAQYIAAQMGAWRSKLRRAQEPDCMASIAGLLAPEDIAAVSAWAASRRVAPDAAPLPAGSLKPPMDCGGV